MTQPHSDPQSARIALLQKEKALTRAKDELAAARRALPATPVTKDYMFDTNLGPASLSDLFCGKRQLVLYHFMFGADWTAGCKSCSFWADNLSGIEPHLAARDTMLMLVSNAPLKTLLAYRDRMGWSLPWVSTNGSSFNYDFGVSFTPEQLDSPDYVYNHIGTARHGTEAPGLSCFLKSEDGQVLHSYSTYGRGVEHVNGAYQLLDLTPLGRQEEGLNYGMEWLQRRDEYGHETLARTG